VLQPLGVRRGRLGVEVEQAPLYVHPAGPVALELFAQGRVVQALWGSQVSELLE
jgi:hypothetical protein